MRQRQEKYPTKKLRQSLFYMAYCHGKRIPENVIIPSIAVSLEPKSILGLGALRKKRPTSLILFGLFPSKTLKFHLALI
jgi:hypothetical protein